MLLPAAALAAGRTPRTYSSATGRPLTALSKQSPADVALDFLRARGLAAADAASVRVAAQERAATGLTQVRLEQQVSGLHIHDAYARAAVDDQGQLIHLIDRLVSVPAGGVVPARIGGAEAVRAAMSYLFPKGTTFYRAPTAERVAIPTAAGTLEEGFVVETWTLKTNQLNETLVGGDGRVISTELRTNWSRPRPPPARKPARCTTSTTRTA